MYLCRVEFGSQDSVFESRWRRNSVHDCMLLHCTKHEAPSFSLSPFHCLTDLNNIERDVKHLIIIIRLGQCLMGCATSHIYYMPGLASVAWMLVGLVICGLRVRPPSCLQYSFIEIGHEIFSMVILSLPLIQEGQLSVSNKRMCTILVNCLED